jgi:protein-S-isoprenylcysteine O-methyltransferase Ste14
MSKAPTVGMDEWLRGERLLRAITNSAAYEWILRRAITAWFIFLAINMASGLASSVMRDWSALSVREVAEDLSRLCMLLFFCMAAWLTLVRSQPIAKAPGIRPRLAALVGVTLLFTLDYFPRLPDPPAWLLFLSAGLTLFGNILMLFVLRRLGQSFSVMAEARRLVTAGPYAIVRHPLYLTEAVSIIGIFLPYWSLSAGLLFALLAGVQLLRMHYEEQVLRETFPEYAAYAERIPRLIPGVW